MLRQIISNQWFALVDLLLVIVSGVIWMIKPEMGLWSFLVAMLPWGLRSIAGKFPYQRTPFDWLMAIFLATAWIGYWSAYDKTSAWSKIWLIVTAILLYYALSAQPKQNFKLLSFISFIFGVGISIYFFLTHDFAIDSGGIALLWMSKRPQVDWTSIHHGHVAGLLVISSSFASYWVWNDRRKLSGYRNIAIKIILVLGVGGIVGAFLLSMSRGIWVAIACGLGIWLFWIIATSSRFSSTTALSSYLPVLTLVCLGAMVIYVYMGPASTGGFSSQSDYGRNTRAELHERALYFLADYPITGGGLNSFPGLYSQYMIVIPFFYFVNSYNIFLDIGIEQGLVGGLAFIGIYLGGIWVVSQTIVKTRGRQTWLVSWLSLFTLIFTLVHGLFYDYLYNGNGTVLLFFPVGFSMIGVLNMNNSETKIAQPMQINTGTIRKLTVILILSIAAIIVINISRIRSVWYANLGAVQMSQAELVDFPKGKWAETEIVPKLGSAEASLHTSLQFDPTNRTANYRLGMISMLRRDFVSAVQYLETAYTLAPNHRGVIKSLAYCYIWLNDVEKAQGLLTQIPEAVDELDVYIWWWGTQGRRDLSENAKSALEIIKTEVSKP